MGKALLTDEIIERANRGEYIDGPLLMDDEETKVISIARKGTFGYAAPRQAVNQETLQIEVEPTVIKSRRIENQKRSIFQAKLNKILFGIVLLLIGLIVAIIWL